MRSSPSPSAIKYQALLIDLYKQTLEGKGGSIEATMLNDAMFDLWTYMNDRERELAQILFESLFSDPEEIADPSASSPKESYRDAIGTLIYEGDWHAVLLLLRHDQFFSTKERLSLLSWTWKGLGYEETSHAFLTRAEVMSSISTPHAATRPGLSTACLTTSVATPKLSTEDLDREISSTQTSKNNNLNQ